MGKNALTINQPIFNIAPSLSDCFKVFFNERSGTFGGIAQLGERLHGMQEVSGSIPLISTKA